MSSGFTKTFLLQFLRNYSKQSTIIPIDMAYTAYGDINNTVPPLMVMHSVLSCRKAWQSFCENFHKHTDPQRTVIALDARNHGHSPQAPVIDYNYLTEDLKTFLLKSDIKKASLYGHCMGGRTVMHFALKYPELTEKLIVGDVSPTYREYEDFEAESVLKDCLEVITQIKLPEGHIPIAAAKEDVEKQLAESNLNPKIFNYLLDNIGKNFTGNYLWLLNIPVIFNDYPKLFKFPDTKCLQQFTGPVLFITGSESAKVEKDPARILELFPNAHFVEIENGTHFLHMEYPQDFIKVCTDFLNEDMKNDSK